MRRSRSGSDDITERKRADEDRAFQLTLLETLNDAVVSVDCELRLRSWNKGAERLYGWSVAEVLGQHVDLLGTLFAEVGRKRTFQQIDAGTHARFELVQRRRDGTPITVEGEAAALRDRGGRITGYLFANRDVTERKRVREADAANRAKSAFLANMSHEIRTPLNAILGYSQLMARDGSLPANARCNLEVINRSGEHVLALVNDVLEMSKIESGRSSLKVGTFDLRGMVLDLEAMFRLRAAEKRLTFRVLGAEAVPPGIVADEGKVRQVLVNLLSNAMKFTREGGVILRLSATLRAGARLQVTAAVEDTGVGIAAEEIGKLFQHFGQTESGRQAQVGTGLGLAISREHARLMGGDILVTSEAGKGSVFRFEFPADEGSAEACAARRASRRVVGITAAGAVPRVLVVDDLEANRGWLRQLLASIGFELREATDGQEAVETCRVWKPDLVLMDMRMPRMDGHEATRAIREGDQGTGKKVAIIAMTASVFPQDRQDVLRTGADDFIGKPVRELELQSWLSKPRAPAISWSWTTHRRTSRSCRAC